MTTIRIADVGCMVEYTLSGEQLTMTESGGCRDALAGLALSESMTDDEILALVRERWVDGYDGDPKANRLGIYVARAADHGARS